MIWCHLNVVFFLFFVFTFATKSITFCLCLLKLHGIASFKDGSHAETHIDIKVIVEDENDNPPVFLGQEPAYIKERCPQGEWGSSLPTFSDFFDEILLTFMAAKSESMYLIDENECLISYKPLCKKPNKDVK